MSSLGVEIILNFVLNFYPRAEAGEVRAFPFIRGCCRSRLFLTVSARIYRCRRRSDYQFGASMYVLPGPITLRPQACWRSVLIGAGCDLAVLYVLLDSPIRHWTGRLSWFWLRCFAIAPR